jgi:hypothetical protein
LPTVLAANFVLLVEGEKDVDTASRLGLAATCNPGGARRWREEYSDCLRGKRVAIISDADDPGRKHAEQVAASLAGKVESLKVLELDGAKDLTEWVERGGAKDSLLEHIRHAPGWVASAIVPSEVTLVAIAVEELLAKQIKLREMLLEPILPEQGLALLYSYRGISKTFLALGMGLAVASAAHFLRWVAPRPRKVLYVDGAPRTQCDDPRGNGR